MKLKNKVLAVILFIFIVSISMAGATMVACGEDVYNPLGDWTKVGAETVSLSAKDDGALHLSESATGSWAAQAYTAVTYNYGIMVDNRIDVYVNVLSGKTHFALASNGWYYNMQGATGNSAKAADITISNTGDGNVELQETSTWSIMSKSKSEGYDKVSFIATETATEVYFNDELFFSFASPLSDYYGDRTWSTVKTPGTALLSVGRFSPDSVLDVDIMGIPVASESKIEYNLASSADLLFGYHGVKSANITEVKYAQEGAGEFTSLASEKYSVSSAGIMISKDNAKEIFQEQQNYSVLVKTNYGNIVYELKLTNEKNASNMWQAQEISNAFVSAMEDGGICYKNDITSNYTENARTYEFFYIESFSLEKEIAVDFLPVNGIGSIALTNGINGKVILEFAFRKGDKEGEVVYNVNYENNWPVATMKSGYNRLSFQIGAETTDILLNGVKLCTVQTGGDEFTERQVGVKIGCFHVSWAKIIEFHARVGVAQGLKDTLRYVKNSGKDIVFTYSAPFASVSELKLGAEVISADNYTLTKATENAGSISFSAQQAESLFSTPQNYEIVLQTSMGEVVFHLQVVEATELEIPVDVLSYDLYTGKDLQIPVYINLDTVTGVKEGERVLTEEEFLFDAETESVILKEIYLKELSAGEHVLHILTALVEEGVAFTVQVEDRTPADVVSSELTFDKNEAKSENAVFEFNLRNDTFISASQNGITSNDYEMLENILTIKKEFLSSFAANETYTFVVHFSYGEVEVSIKVINTTPPYSQQASKNFNLSSPSDVVFSVETYENELIALTGNNITAEDYAFENKTLTIFKSYLSSREAGEYQFAFETAAGTLNLTVIVEEKIPPQVESDLAVYDVQNPSSVQFNFTMNGGVFLSLSGEGITEKDYIMDGSVLEIKEEFLSTLRVGEYTFVFEADNGKISLNIAVQNDVAPSFEKDRQREILRERVTGSEDFEVDIYHNGGKLLNISGDDITQQDYSFTTGISEDINVLTFKADFLAQLGVGDFGKYTLVFDNGTLTIEIRFDYKTDNTHFYSVNSATVKSAEDGYTSISQTAIASEFNWGYVTDYTGEIDVNKPIRIMYKFPQNPDKNWMYTFNISAGSYNYFWDTEKTVFVQFGVDGNSFYQLRAGSYPKEEWNYLQIPNLNCYPDGENEFIIKIGQEKTQIYINGVLVNESDRKLSDFTDSKAYLRFSSTTTYSDTTPYCEYLVKVNGEVSAKEKVNQFNVKAPKRVSYQLVFEEGQFEGMFYKKEDGSLEKLSAYSFLYEQFAKSGILTLEKEDILSSEILSKVGTHTLVVKSTGGSYELILIVSDAEALQPEESVFLYDKRKEEDLKINIWLNLDTFASLEGNEISESDYMFEDGKLIINKDFLLGLPYGESIFLIKSEKNPQGIEIKVNVADFSEPEIETDKADFDIQNPADVVLKIDVKAGTFDSVLGNNISQNDYVYDADAKTLTLKKEFLSSLGAAKYTFIAKVVLFDEPYELAFTIDCLNSHSPVFEDGTNLKTEVFNKNAPEDIKIKVVANKGKFLALYGSYISSSDYEYNAETGEIVIKKEYLQTLATGTENTININFDNGKIDIVVKIEEKEVETPSTGCNGSIYTSAAIGMSVITLICGFILLKKREADEK